jgi:rfaE bifunctional protein kinase chain/domain
MPAVRAEAIDSLRGRRVLVVGDLMLDRTIEGDVERVSPEAPVPVLRRSRDHAHPGGAANTAANVVSLGGRVQLIGLAGADDAAEVLRAELERAGIPDSSLVVGERRTTVKTRVVAGQQQLVRVDDEDARPAEGAEEDRLLEAIAAAVADAEAVVISDYAKGVVTSAIAQATLALGRDRGLPTVVDPKQRDFARYQDAGVVVPNRSEALAAAALDGLAVEADPLATCGRTLLERYRVGAVLVTLGPQGMILFERGRDPVAIPSRARSAFDVTGAGDTVVATLGLALAAGIELAEAAALATLAAGLAVEQTLTAAVSNEALVGATVDGPDSG